MGNEGLLIQSSPHLNKLYQNYDWFCTKQNSCIILIERIKEIDNLRTENENLRRVFEIATNEFNKKEQLIKKLQDEPRNVELDNKRKSSKD